MDGEETDKKDSSDSAGDRREYNRISAECPMVYRIADPSEEGAHGNLLHRISSVPSLEIPERIYTQQEETDQTLELLLWLDLKVSFLIKNLPGRGEKDFFPYEGIIIDISVSGMKFCALKELSPGSHLECNFVLPIIPFKEMYLAGEVIRSVAVKKTRKSTSEYDISLAFKEIKEPEKEQIIRYVVKRQMQLQREKARQD